MDILFVSFGRRSRCQGMIDIMLFLQQRDVTAGIVRLAEFWRVQRTPQFVGLSAFTENSGELRPAIAAVRERWPDAKIIIGGPHVVSDVLSRERDLHELADYLVIGEGEYATLRIVNGGEMPGVVNGGLLSQGDFERLPFPNIDHGRQLFGGRPELITLNRGCPYNCSFCHANRKRLVYRDPGEAVAYLKRMEPIRGRRKWFVVDDIFAVNVEWLADFVRERSKQNHTTPLRCFINGRNFTEERLDLLCRAGVVHASLGAESADEKVLRLANKGTTLADYERIDAMFRKRSGIDLHCLWMLGLPGETTGSLAATLDAARKLGTRKPVFNFAVPYPGTRFYRMHEMYGRLVDDDWAKWTPQRVTFVPFGVSKQQMREAMQQGKRIRRKR